MKIISIHPVVWNKAEHYCIKTDRYITMSRREVQSASDNPLTPDEEMITSLCDYIMKIIGKE